MERLQLNFTEIFYKNLIDRCCKENLSEIITFDEIVSDLKTNKSFITHYVNEGEYYQYVKFIEESRISFNSGKQVEILNDYVKSNFEKQPNTRVEIEKPTTIHFDFNLINITNLI